MCVNDYEILFGVVGVLVIGIVIGIGGLFLFMWLRDENKY